MVIPSRSCTSGRPLDYECTGTYIHKHISPALTFKDVLQQSQKSRFNAHLALMLHCCSNWRGNWKIQQHKQDHAR